MKYLPWKHLCFRFIGRSRRHDSLVQLKAPQVIIDKEKQLIQQAYEEMRDACLDNKLYKATWDYKPGPPPKNFKEPK